MRILGPLLLLCSVGAAPAAALTILARVNKDRVALNDQVLLTVQIRLDQGGAPKPQLPSIPNFNIHSAGSRTNMQFINGVVSSTVESDYVLVPRFVGNAVIPPITVTHNGTSARTKPLTIRVLPADTATPAPAPERPAQETDPRAAPRRDEQGPDMFITAEVDKKDPYVNEQVMMTVRFYLGVQALSDSEYEFPDTHGFARENLGTLPPRNVSNHNRHYVLHEIRTALFPINAGTLHVGPTKITVKVQDRIDINTEGPDFFRMFFSQPLVSVKKKTIQTKALKVKARALPKDGKPHHFSGAVGTFSIRAEVEPSAAKVGEAVTLTATIKGRGNIKTLGDISLPTLDDFRVYETVSSLNIETDVTGVKGAKSYKTVLVPRVSGTLTIPPIPFSYFDPDKKEYVALQTHSIDLPVSPGDAATAPVGYQAQGSGSQITRITADIRHIKSSLHQPTSLRFASALTGAVWPHMIPSLIFILCSGRSFYRNRLLRDPARRRFRDAFARARKRIANGTSSGEAPARLAEALTGYLSDKLGIPAAGLTQREAQQRLKERFPKLPEGHFNQIKLLWEELEVMRFAPQDGRDNDASRRLEKEVEVLLEALEEVIGK
ncbi:MAG: BatD family protein [Elusimicrobiota bacterium]